MKRQRLWMLALVPVTLALMAISCFIFFQPGIVLDAVFLQQVSADESVTVYQYKNKSLTVQNYGNTFYLHAGNGVEIGEFAVSGNPTTKDFSVFYKGKLVCIGTYIEERNQVHSTLLDKDYETQLKLSASSRFPREGAMVIHPDQLIAFAAGEKNTYRGRAGFLIISIVVLGILMLTTKPPKAWYAARQSLAATGESGQPLAGGANMYNVVGAWWVPSGKAATINGNVTAEAAEQSIYYKMYCAVMCLIALWFFLLALRLI